MSERDAQSERELRKILDAIEELTRNDDVSGALIECTRLIEEAHRSKIAWLEAAGLQRRAIANDMLGEPEAAERDARAAIAIDSKLGSKRHCLRQDLYTLGVILAGRKKH